MLLEDDMAIAEMYSLGLRIAGYNVACFPDPAALFTALEVRTPDILVLDWNLRAETGREVLKDLRADARTRTLPVVVLSNLREKDAEAAFAFRAGALAWLEKPKTTPAQLATDLARHIPDRRLQARG